VDDRAAGDERRRDLPAREQEREVPGRDQPADSHRLTQRVAERAPSHGDRPSGDLAGPSGVVVEDLGDEGHVDLGGLEDGLALIERFELGQLVAVLEHEVRELPDQLAAVGPGHLGPIAAVQGGAGRPHGVVHVLGARLGDPRQRPAGPGIDPPERAAAAPSFHSPADVRRPG
jgi:hypothetical protein